MKEDTEKYIVWPLLKRQIFKSKVSKTDASKKGSGVVLNKENTLGVPQDNCWIQLTHLWKHTDCSCSLKCSQSFAAEVSKGSGLTEHPFLPTPRGVPLKKQTPPQCSQRKKGEIQLWLPLVITQWFGLEGTLKVIWFQLSCYREGHLPLDHVALNTSSGSSGQDIIRTCNSTNTHSKESAS